MASNSALQSQISRVAERYSSLFTLPSGRTILKYIFASCLIGGLADSISYDPSLYGLNMGFFIGISSFLATLFADYLNDKLFMRGDPILDFRRCSFLSIPSSLILFISASAANIASTPVGDLDLWFKILAAGFFGALTLRLFVLSALSTTNYWRTLFSALLQPVLLLFLLSMPPVIEHGFRPYFLMPFLVSFFLALLGLRLFVFCVDAVGKERFGIRSLSLFKAFVASWTESLNEPLEDFFERFGEERNVKVSLLVFKTKKGINTAVAIPAIHPGPFKNVGSSPLPGMIQASLEDKLRCIVSVPHGISGHDLDLASQIQNEKIITKILDSTNFESFNSYATPFVRSEVEGAKASCQIFGDCALFTLTLAPETMEDLPKELDHTIIQEAKKRGLATAITIDAHNSIQGPFDLTKAAELLRKAAVEALEKAVRCRQYSFEVGAAEVNPTEFGVSDGLGPGGVSVVVVKVGDQKVAYVTIDGNNMVSGLREQILTRLKALGLADGEVLTTDTHIVNGVVKVDRGYYPIGEAIDRERLTNYIEKAASEALKNLETAESSWRVEEVYGVKIIGEKQLREMCLLTERTLRRTKRTAMLIFPSLAVMLTVILIFL
ncbi:MAG: DUF2070 family protein [Candidatus Bathyarchaeia archaeon]